MARRRFFVDSIRGGVAELRGEEARHLTRVLRVEAGQRFEISDNRAAYLAEIVEARGERVVFRVEAPIEAAALPVEVTLAAALIKFDRFEWIVEKATELGVARIVPVEATRTERGLFEASRKRSERWERIARESSQQSRRTTLPEIAPAVRFAGAVGMEAEARLFLEEGEAPPLLRRARRAADRDGGGAARAGGRVDGPGTGAGGGRGVDGCVVGSTSAAGGDGGSGGAGAADRRGPYNGMRQKGTG